MKRRTHACSSRVVVGGYRDTDRQVESYLLRQERDDLSTNSVQSLGYLRLNGKHTHTHTHRRRTQSMAHRGRFKRAITTQRRQKNTGPENDRPKSAAGKTTASDKLSRLLRGTVVLLVLLFIFFRFPSPKYSWEETGCISQSSLIFQ